MASSREFVPRPAEGLGHPNVIAMVRARVGRSAQQPALRHKEGGAWRTLSWDDWFVRSRELAAGLLSLGVARGDRVAILSKTCVHWVVADLACAIAGAVSVPIYTSLRPDDVEHILSDSGAVAVFIDEIRRLPGATASGVQPRHRILFGRAPAPDAEHGPATEAPPILLETLVSAGRAALDKADGVAATELDAVEAGLSLDDPMTIVYTSGTTGTPRGAVLSHGNLVYESWAIRNVVPVDHTDEQLVVLPLAHIFARHLVWGAIEQGAVTAFAESDDRLGANLQEIAPTFVGAVPRMYERLYAIMSSEAAGRGGPGRAVYEYSLDIGRRVSVCRQRGQAVPTALALKMMVADRSVFRRIRSFFGGRLRYLVSGGAPLSREVAEFFHAAGVLILEGYGLSETSGATNVNRPERYRFGTVGPAMPGCEVRIADDGEVVVRGHNVMTGYHGQPELTAAAFDEQGWLRTGDLGEVRDGFLRITGRKNDIFKTSSGNFVAPQLIEKRLHVREGIAHVFVSGDGRPYPIALISLDEEQLLALSDREGLGCRSYADLVAHPRVRSLIQSAVDAVNDALARHERVQRFAIVPRPMTEDSGELTPTRKVKRRVVAAKYEGLVQSLYDEPPPSASSSAPR